MHTGGLVEDIQWKLDQSGTCCLALILLPWVGLAEGRPSQREDPYPTNTAVTTRGIQNEHTGRRGTGVEYERHANEYARTRA
jgi:hypothetical protein